jgi:hypothetical protein
VSETRSRKDNSQCINQIVVYENHSLIPLGEGHFGEPSPSLSPTITANGIIKGLGTSSLTARLPLRLSVASVGNHAWVGCSITTLVLRDPSPRRPTLGTIRY